MKPQQAKTEKDRLELETDNFPPDPEKWSILLNDGEISLHAPNTGSDEVPGGFVSIPRDQFDAIIDWYLAEQPGR